MTTLHQPRELRFLLLALAAVLLALAAPPLFADDDDDDGGTSRPSVHRCAIKFVCGDAEGSDRAVDGTYRTAINILNAGATSVGYRKKLALTTPCPEDEEGFEQPGPVLGPIPGNGTPFMLASMNAFDVDCNEVFNEFEAGATCEGGGIAFAEGFLIIESNGPLDVTAVYTGGDGSIDVEPTKCSAGSGGGDDDDDD
jgi:hypothetical protein